MANVVRNVYVTSDIRLSYLVNIGHGSGSSSMSLKT